MSDTQAPNNIPRGSEAESLSDEQGPIPTFKPLKLDDRGRMIPLTTEEREARSDAIQRTLRVLRVLPDDDPPGIEEEIMRGIDSHRPDGFKLFEGYDRS